MSEVKPYSPTEMVGEDSNGEEFVRGGLDVERVRATFVAIEVERERWRGMALGAQARIEELEAALEAIEKVVEMALECDESMEWLAEKVGTVLGKAKP